MAYENKNFTFIALDEYLLWIFARVSVHKGGDHRNECKRFRYTQQ